MCDERRRRRLDVDNDHCGLLRSQLGSDDTVPTQFNVTIGSSTTLETNVYPVVPSGAKLALFQYSVETDPEIMSAKLLNHLVHSAICPDGGRRSESARWNSTIFDGSKTLFSVQADLSCQRFLPSKTDPSKGVTVTVKLAKEVPPDNTASLLRIDNTIFRSAYRSVGLQCFRRKWLDDQDTKAAGGFRVIGGFVPVVTSLSSGLSFIVDTTARIDRSGTVYDFLKSAIANVVECRPTADALKELQLVTTHLKRPRLVRVSNIVWDSDPSQRFFDRIDRRTKEAIRMSIADYFQHVHNISVQRDDPIIEMLATVNGATKVECFPASLLKVTGLTEAERRDFQFMRKIREVATISADARKRKLDSFVSKLRSEPASTFLARWGLDLGESIWVDGRVLAPPVLKFRSRQLGHSVVDVHNNAQMSFRSDLRNVGVAVPSRLNSPPLVVTPESCAGDVRSEFVPKLMQLARDIDVPFRTPDVLILSNVHHTAYRIEICQHLQTNGTPSFAIVIFPDVNKERYDAVKHLLTVDLGVPSQFVKAQTLFASKAGAGSVHLNLLLQITAKTGGIPYYVSPDTLPLAHTMVIGVAVSRGTICALTSSYDQTLSRYKSTTFSIDSFDGVVPADRFGPFITAAMDRFIQQFGDPPRRVVVFRDGVSYGLMPRLKTDEVPAVRSAVRGASLVYCVVQRRSHLKLMAGRGKLMNPAPGTVVSERIGANGVAEFYLISHEANQGMASPTRYTIIHHFPVTWKDDHFVQLTHYLTCQYPNWSGAIRVPCALMLASKLADLCRLRLSSDHPNECLSEFLHFI
jgi:hypothetical protein